MYSPKSIDAFAKLVAQRSRLPKHRFSRKVILVEHHSIYRQHIPYILLSLALARHHGAEPVLFRVDNKVAKSRVPKFLRRLKERADIGSTGRLFRACGLSRNLHLSHHAERFLKRAGEIVKRELVGVTLQDVERYELQGVPIGDLLYDDFLAMGNTTIDTNSHDFFLHAKSFIASVLAWHSYFLRCHVMAVVTNHVYRQGVPARIANYSGIDTFEAGLHRVARISREQPALSESSNFREVFEGLEECQQREALRSADRIIEEMKSGARVDHTNWHLPERQSNESDLAALRSHQGKKVMLALHCLSDSPHVKGLSLFPDYAAWIQGTLTAVQGTDVLVVLKPHPACPKVDEIEELVAGQSNYLVVSAKNSLQDLANVGVSQVVTFFGNISFEAALLGLDAVNLTHQNPHANYQFGYAPSGTSEYYNRVKSSLVGLTPYPQDELREYAYMSRLHWNHNLFFSQTNDIVARAEGEGNPGEWLVERFLSEFETKDFQLLHKSLVKFVAGNQQRFQGAA